MELNLILAFAAGICGAYLLGSLPSAVWLGKWFHGIDVREHGSGNAGATNVFRVLGPGTAIPVLIIDALKGSAAVGLSGLASNAFASSEWFLMYSLLLGALALLGHVFPLFAGFRGGKGIATLAGIGLVLFPVEVLISLGVFILVFLPFRYVSLGSIMAAIAFPVAVWFVNDPPLFSQMGFAMLVAVFVPLTHKKNIVRLLKGNENKIRFGSKTKASGAGKP